MLIWRSDSKEENIKNDKSLRHSKRKVRVINNVRTSVKGTIGNNWGHLPIEDGLREWTREDIVMPESNIEERQ